MIRILRKNFHCICNTSLKLNKISKNICNMYEQYHAKLCNDRSSIFFALFITYFCDKFLRATADTKIRLEDSVKIEKLQHVKWVVIESNKNHLFVLKFLISKYEPIFYLFNFMNHTGPVTATSIIFFYFKTAILLNIKRNNYLLRIFRRECVRSSNQSWHSA